MSKTTTKKKRAKKPAKKPSALVTFGRMIGHQERLDALTLFTTADEAMSPKQVAAAMKVNLPNVSYHVKQLVELGALELRYTLPRRGAVEHFYSPAAGVAQRLAEMRTAAEKEIPAEVIA